MRFLLTSILCVFLATAMTAPVALAQADPEPRPDGDLLLADDFDDGAASALASYGDEWMTWEVAGGVGTLSSSSADNELAAQYPAPAATDVLIEVDLRFASDQVEGAGVTFRGSDLLQREDTVWHYYHVGVRPGTKAIELGRLTEGLTEVEDLGACKLPPSLSNFADFRTLRVEVVGPEILAFVDGAFVCEWSDDVLTAPGLVGFYLGVPEDISSKSVAVVEFARLRVYAPAAATPPAEKTPTEQPPTEEPTVPVEGTPAAAAGPFEDDFADDGGGWRLGDDDSGEVRIEDGALIVRNLTTAPVRTDTSPGVMAADVDFEVDVTFLDGSDDNWHTLFCRREERSDYATSFSADGYYGANLFVNGESVRRQEPVATDVIIQGAGEINHARLACIGTQIRFWVNDTLLVDWTDDTLAAGDFGVAVSSMDGEYSEVAFDNFVADIQDGASDDKQSSTKEQPAGDQGAEAPALEAIVTAATLNVRGGPGATYAKVGTVRKDDRLPVTDYNAACTWVKVVTPTTEGWVSTGYVTLTGPCGAAGAVATPAAAEPTRAAAQAAATPAAPVAGAAMVTDFESFGTWRRGDETWGEFVQSGEQAYAGSYAGKLTYDFPANIPGDRNYVVFLRTIPIAGSPDRLEMQVYGDGSGSFLNVWVKDAAAQVWQFSFGPVTHTGWKQMTAPLDPSLDWPVQPIGGSASTVAFPVALNALVLDYPSDKAAAGTIYFDDLKAHYP